MQSNFIEITLWHLCSPVNLMHIFRNLFPRTPLDAIKMSTSFKHMNKTKCSIQVFFITLYCCFQKLKIRYRTFIVIFSASLKAPSKLTRICKLCKLVNPIFFKLSKCLCKEFLWHFDSFSAKMSYFIWYQCNFYYVLKLYYQY